ncbi:MAG: S-adenosylmethionine:tRNA ribosyltransferase-isomerase [Bacteroidales bacterium]
MKKPEDIRIEDFDYPLPDDRIAKFPLAERDSSKLLLYRGGNIAESVFRELPNYLPHNSILVFNNTKVIQARLHFRKESGALIEIFCLEPYSPSDYLLSFQSTQLCSWVCLVGNSKKWKGGELKRTITISGETVTLTASKEESDEEPNHILFTWDNSSFTFASLLDAIGELPIPPYLNRKAEDSDKVRYQTVYSKIEGSVAAPTAGLHFSKEVFVELAKSNIDTAELTLHVGAGTFKPVKSDTIGGHEMHTEFISVSRDLIENLAATDKKIIAVGTTSVRTLESLYHIGVTLDGNSDKTSVSLKVSQWQPYEKVSDITRQQAFSNIVDYLKINNLSHLVTSTQIIIVPGYKFRVVDGIITNFHQPKSTLLLLISAFVEGNWRSIYDYALAGGFRFLSYGDSSLLLKE